MKYFPKRDPTLISAMNKLIKNKEHKILEDIKRVDQLKKVNLDKLDRPTARVIFE